ncbi:hypothetical protein [Anaerosolibacter sp.]|uniref:hypothetical protein n=1 Tax=Anaerosolibacter sp. TaxID=1872527 RepID=UPI0039F0FB5B
MNRKLEAIIDKNYDARHRMLSIKRVNEHCIAKDAKNNQSDYARGIDAGRRLVNQHIKRELEFEFRIYR